MSLISTSIPNLINGVSQQPFNLRLASQADEQINGLSSVVDGLKKRPPTKHVARFRSTPVEAAFTHVIDRDKTEKYIVVIQNGDLTVYDLKGVRKTVNFPDGKDYLVSATPEEGFAAVSVADYTFIVNKATKVAVAESSIPTPRPYEGLIWIKQGAYSSTYTVDVDGSVATYVTLDASNAANQSSIQTSTIAGNLFSQLKPQLEAKGVSIIQTGSTLYFTCARDFGMAIYDSQGDTSMELVKNSVQRFSDLPARGIAGFKVRVAGSTDAVSDDYYVQYISEPTNPFGGTWTECVKDGVPIDIDGSTMPHLLVRDADGTFSFEQAVFDPRKAGDLDSVPWPSIVGQTISDVFFHRNRLGLLSDENIVLSRAGEFFKFFKASAIQALDTDPIDVAVSHVKVSLLRAALPFNESLLLFSDQSQFQMTKSDILTPKSVGVNLTTEFSCNLKARPVGAGTNVYFAQSRDGYSGVREYYTDPDTTSNDATDVTSHVPTYVPGEIRKMAATTNENVIACLSDTVRDTIFIYRYYWARQEKLQSSWSKWVLPAGSSILDVAFINSTLVLIISREDGSFIETINLASGVHDDELNYQVYLDRKFDDTIIPAIAYFPVPGQRGSTNINFPYRPLPGEEYLFVARDGNPGYKAGQIIPHTFFIAENGVPTVNFQGKVTRFYGGVRYAFRYRFSTFVVREQAPGGSGMQAISEGRLQIRKLAVSYSGTGYFRAEVTPYGRSTYTYPFSGRVLGSAQNKTGETALETGTFQFPVVSKNDQVKIEIINDSYLPCAFLSAEWEGFYTIRSRRM